VLSHGLKHTKYADGAGIAVLLLEMHDHCQMPEMIVRRAIYHTSHMLESCISWNGTFIVRCNPRLFTLHGCKQVIHAGTQSLL